MLPNDNKSEQNTNGAYNTWDELFSVVKNLTQVLFSPMYIRRRLTIDYRKMRDGALQFLVHFLSKSTTIFLTCVREHKVWFNMGPLRTNTIVQQCHRPSKIAWRHSAFCDMIKYSCLWDYLTVVFFTAIVFIRTNIFHKTFQWYYWHWFPIV